MSGKQYSIYPRKLKGKTVFYCQFRLPDGTRTNGRPTGRTSKKDAEIWAIEQIKKAEHEIILQTIEEQKAKGIFTNIHGDQIALADFAGSDFFAWEGRWALSKRAGGKRLSPRHCLESCATWRKHVLPVLGRMMLSDIDENALEDFRNGIYKQGLSDSVNHKCLLLIKAALMAAKRAKLLSHVPDMPQTGSRQVHKGMLSLDEMKRLFESPWRDYRAFVANITAAACGARLSELQGLTVQDLDTRNGVVNIRRVWEKRGCFLKDGTKNGRTRIIVIPTRVCRELDSLLAMNPNRGNPEAFIFFEYTNPDRPMNSKVFSRGLYEAMEHIGISKQQRQARHVSFHSWRVFFNSLCLNQGIATAKTQAQLGHLTLRMTEDVYYKPDSMDDIRALQEKIFIIGEDGVH